MITKKGSFIGRHWVKQETLDDIPKLEMRIQAAEDTLRRFRKKVGDPFWRESKKVGTYFGKHNGTWYKFEYTVNGGMGGLSHNRVDPMAEVPKIEMAPAEELPLMLDTLSSEEAKQILDGRLRGRLPDPVFRHDLVETYFRIDARERTIFHFLTVARDLIHLRINREYRHTNPTHPYNDLTFIVPINGREYIFQKNKMICPNEIVRVDPIGTTP